MLMISYAFTYLSLIRNDVLKDFITDKKIWTYKKHINVKKWQNADGIVLSAMLGILKVPP